MKQIQKNILIYCRESRDDNFENYERIETQRDILIKYCKSKNLGDIVDVVMDDNKSGTDFRRLDVIKNRIENGEINIILTKDASRLGRNVLESLNFIAFLENHKVELIFESEEYNEDLFPIIAWFNERRAKEDSLKIRRVLRHKMENGEIVIKAPYGYIKNGNKLIVDEKSARVVKEIFHLYIKGLGKSEIADIMNKKNYPTPAQLKSQYKNTGEINIWNRQHIDRILKHLVYTGDMPYGMRKKSSFKSKKYEYVDRKDWIVVPQHHEAIVSKEVFELAQSKIKKRTRTKRSKSIFSDILFCGGCESRMYRRTQSGKKAWYSCSKSCTGHRIMEHVLIEIVETYIKELAKHTLSEQDVDRLLNQNMFLAQEIAKVKEDSEKLQAKILTVYNDKLNATLPLFLLEKKLAELTQELSENADTLESLQNEFQQMYNIKSSADKFLYVVKQIIVNAMNSGGLTLFFDKIFIFRAGEINPHIQEIYSVSNNDYKVLYDNGGLLFIQNFIFHTDLEDTFSSHTQEDAN